MRNILLLFAKYGAPLLFIGLEILCFYLIVNYNKNQREIFLNSSMLFAGKLNEKVDNARDYFHLEHINDSLQLENARLLQRLFNNRNALLTEEITDSSWYKFEFIPASICGSTIHKRFNYFTLCSGSKEGITPGMGVVTGKGVVGIVRHTSSHYSVVLPLINGLSRTSCVIKNKNYPGILSWSWESHDPKMMILDDVPKHANIAVGDTVITSGYSTIFPKGIELGTVTNFTAESGSATYKIDVRLREDLSNLEYVYVLKNQHKPELDSLRNLITDE